MSAFTITIDGKPVQVSPGDTVLDAARKIGVDIPTLCHLEKCGPQTSCLVCMVKVVANGRPRMAPSCATKALPGMVIESETEEVHETRRTALELLFSDHVGDCLSPCHRLCPLQLNIPAMIRLVAADRLEDAIVTIRQSLPLPSILGRLCHHPCEQGCRRGQWDDPAAIRDMERFVTDHDFESSQPHQPENAATTGKSVVIVGAGPAGLAAANDLARHGHHVTVVDRRPNPGGTLNDLSRPELPIFVLDEELGILSRMGIHFKAGVELGRDVTLDGLLRGFDAVLLAIGEIETSQQEKLGVPFSGTSLKTDPVTCHAGHANVFAAGAAVKPVKQLVRAMAEGRAAAVCIHQFLNGHPPHRPEKPFGSTMGRIEPGELREFLRTASPVARAAPCDRCAGPTRIQAVSEAARCLHCDCRSSGHCALQHYAQVYGVDANRFRSGRRTFEQQIQPGGVIFEPGKCILCGICVRLTEMAAEPLGLTFVGRGFDVRVAAPFDLAIEKGLQKVAAECVRQCPTGALEFSDAGPQKPA